MPNGTQLIPPMDHVGNGGLPRFMFEAAEFVREPCLAAPSDEKQTPVYDDPASVAMEDAVAVALKLYAALESAAQSRNFPMGTLL
jgi:hypothetical protein